MWYQRDVYPPLAHLSDAWTKQNGEELMRSHDLRSHFLTRGVLVGVEEVGLPGALRLRATGAGACEAVAMEMTKECDEQPSAQKIKDRSTASTYYPSINTSHHHHLLKYIISKQLMVSTIFIHGVIQSESPLHDDVIHSLSSTNYFLYG